MDFPVLVVLHYKCWGHARAPSPRGRLDMPTRQSDSSAALETGASPYFERPIALVGPTELSRGPRGNRLAGCRCTSPGPRSLVLAPVSLLFLSLHLRICGLQCYHFVFQHVLWYLHSPGCTWIKRLLDLHGDAALEMTRSLLSKSNPSALLAQCVLLVTPLGLGRDKASEQAIHGCVEVIKCREGQGE